MLGPNYNTTPAGLQPSYGGEILNYLVTVTVAAQRLGTLLITAGSTFPNGIPLLTDELSTGPGTQQVRLRPPWHVFFRVRTDQTTPVFMTWDNATTPVANGPGFQLDPGVLWTFGYNGGVSLLRPKVSGKYLVPATSAFQFIAAGPTQMLVTFSD